MSISDGFEYNGLAYICTKIKITIKKFEDRLIYIIIIIPEEKLEEGPKYS